MKHEDKLIALAELYGGIWIYAPEAKNPALIWLGRDMNISHSEMFAKWDGKQNIPIAGLPYNDFVSYMDRSILLTIIQEKIQADEYLKSKLITYLLHPTAIKNGSMQPAIADKDMILLTCSDTDLADAILKTMGKWKDE